MSAGAVTREKPGRAKRPVPPSVRLATKNNLVAFWKRKIPYLKSPDATVRGLAVWIMGLLGVEEIMPGLEHLMKDEAELNMYMGRRVIKRRVKELAQEALNKNCL